MTWIGVLIALIGALGYALGAALQQREAVTAGATLALVRRPRWWLGGVAGLSGACLHGLALCLAPLVAVQPVSVATLVFAVPLAAMLHGRRPRPAELAGSVAVAIGLLGLILLIPVSGDTPELTDAGAVGLLAGVGVIVAVTSAAARRMRGPIAAVLTAVGAGAVIATVSTFARAVGGHVLTDPKSALHWFTCVIPVLLVWAFVLLQRSYALGYFGIAYASVQVVDLLLSVAAGAFLLGETLPTGWGRAIPALLAGALLVGGTITLARLAPDRSGAAAV